MRKDRFELNVNDLNEMLEKKYGKSVRIEEVDVASIDDQHHPKRVRIGIGGVLTIRGELG